MRASPLLHEPPSSNNNPRVVWRRAEARAVWTGSSHFGDHSATGLKSEHVSPRAASWLIIGCGVGRFFGCGVIVALDRTAPNYYDTCKFSTVGQEPVLVGGVVCEQAN